MTIGTSIKIVKWNKCCFINIFCLPSQSEKEMQPVWKADLSKNANLVVVFCVSASAPASPRGQVLSPQHNLSLVGPLLPPATPSPGSPIPYSTHMLTRFCLCRGVFCSSVCCPHAHCLCLLIFWASSQTSIFGRLALRLRMFEALRSVLLLDWPGWMSITVPSVNSAYLQNTTELHLPLGTCLRAVVLPQSCRANICCRGILTGWVNKKLRINTSHALLHKKYTFTWKTVWPAL